MSLEERKRGKVAATRSAVEGLVERIYRIGPRCMHFTSSEFNKGLLLL